MMMVSLLLWIEYPWYSANAFSPYNYHSDGRRTANSRQLATTTATTTTTTLRNSNQDFVDVDFERVENNSSESSTSTTKTASEDGPANQAWKTQQAAKGKNLLDLSFETADPKWKETRVPFCRSTSFHTMQDDIDDALGHTTSGSDEYIDGKLAFMCELDGQQYGIAVPYDDAVAIVIETTNDTGGKKKNGRTNTVNINGGLFDQQEESEEGNIQYVDPDSYEKSQEYQELMEIMASQVQQYLGADYVLRKTPKVLTVSGGLSKLTDDWERKVMPDPVGVDELLKETSTSPSKDDDLLDEFYSFMKAELGEEEFSKTMNGEDEPFSEDDMELLDLFNVPGMGTQKDDVEGIQELIDSMQNDLAEAEAAEKQNKNKKDATIGAVGGVQEEMKQFEMDTEGMSLKLISFNPDGKQSYSLVKLLQPYVLVGRYAPLMDDDEVDLEDEETFNTNIKNNVDKVLRFELLTPEEERIIVPRLEEICRQDLKEKGLSFQTP